MTPDNQPAENAAKPSRLLLGWPGWALLALVGTLIICWRIHDPRTFWLDEGASLQVSQYDWSTINEAAERDSHPPGSAYLRKAWRDVGDAIGAPHHVFYERGLNLAVWLPWSAFLWLGLRRLLGAGTGAAAAWCIALNPLVLDGIDSIRMYGQAVMFSSGAALALALAIQEALGEGKARGLRWLALYWVLAVASFYTHVLAIPLLGLVGLAWLGASLRFVGWRAPHFRWGLGAQWLAVAAFLPWVPALQKQKEFYNSLGEWHRTEPTFFNLFRQFTEWFTTTPLPEAFHLPWAEGNTSWFLLVNVVLLALCAAGLVKLRRAGGLPRSAAFWGAVAGAFVAVGYIAFTWGATRLDLVHLFHGYRYSFLGGPFWVLAIVCGAKGTAVVLGWKWLLPAAVSLLLAQAGASTLLDERERLRRGLQGAVLDELLPMLTPGQRLYVNEGVLAPYVAGAFPDHEVRSVWDIASHPEDQADADILLLYDWRMFASRRSSTLRLELSASDMCESSEMLIVGDGFFLTYVMRLRGVNHDNLHIAVEHAAEQPHKP